MLRSSPEPQTNAGNQAPGIDTKVATYSVTFHQAGTYILYARLRVGPGGGGDDSFYCGPPVGTVTLNGVTLLGGVSADRLVLNGNALLDQAEQ